MERSLVMIEKCPSYIPVFQPAVKKISSFGSEQCQMCKVSQSGDVWGRWAVLLGDILTWQGGYGQLWWEPAAQPVPFVPSNCLLMIPVRALITSPWCKEGITQVGAGTAHRKGEVFPHLRNKDLGSSPLCLQPHVEGRAPQEAGLPSPVLRDCPGSEESGHLLSTARTPLDLGFPSSLEQDLPLSLLWPAVSSFPCSCCCGVATTLSCKVQLDGTFLHFSYSLSIIFTRQAERSQA